MFLSPFAVCCLFQLPLPLPLLFLLLLLLLALVVLKSLGVGRGLGLGAEWSRVEWGVCFGADAAFLSTKMRICEFSLFLCF